MMPQLIHAKSEIGCCDAKSSPLVGRRKNIHPIIVNAMIQPALFLSVIGSIIALLWVTFDCRALLLQDGGYSPTALWNDPRRPIRTRHPEQEQPSFEVGERIKQGFLGAYLHLCADRRILVSLRVVVDPVDLKQATV